MMMEFVMELVTAADSQDKERTYRRLERIGIDRKTADIMAAEFYNDKEVPRSGR